MTFDKPSLGIGLAILTLSLLNWMGVLTDHLAYTGFIMVLLLGFANARQEVCRLKRAGCAA